MENIEGQDVAEGPAEYRIPSSRWPTFQEKLGKLAKRANKLGAGTIGFEIVRVEHMKLIRFDAMSFLPDEPPADRLVPIDAKVERAFVVGYEDINVVIVTGDRPKLNGWRFVGTLQSLKDDEGVIINILRNIPGETIPAKYRDAEQWCDQCKTRRFRIDTYIVMHDDGRTAQVGSDCLKDFTGHASPDTIARFCEYLIELDGMISDGERGGFGGGEADSLSTLWIVTLASARVRVKGWMSRSKAREIAGQSSDYEARKDTDPTVTGHLRTVTATADAVSDYLDRKLGDKRMREDGVAITEADSLEAEAAIEWIRSMDRNELQRGDNDYLWNLYAACANGNMTWRMLGIVCSLVAAYQRAMGREQERKERASKWANSQFVGTLKTREVFRLKLTAEPRGYTTQFGTSYLHRLEDEAGNQFTMWGDRFTVESGETEVLKRWDAATNDLVEYVNPVYRPWAVDEWVNIKATVVKHEERDGIKSTTINRPALDVPKPVKVRKAKATAVPA
jgi:hypothetical protein